MITVGVLQVPSEEGQGLLPRSLQHTAELLNTKMGLAQASAVQGEPQVSIEPPEKCASVHNLGDVQIKSPLGA